MKKESVELRRLKANHNDYKLLEKWYHNELVYREFEQRKLSLFEIKEKYYPRTLKNSVIPVYIINYCEIPVGMIQYQLVSNYNKEIYGIIDDIIYELDIFIGENDYHNKGIGTIAINLLIDYLCNEKDVNKVIMCPKKDNINAIRCYEKCKFKIVKEFKAEDTIGNMQRYVLMERII